jgi:Transposase DDE domain
MSQPHHTLPPVSEQLHGVINEGWDQEVLPQLPTDYEQQAEQLHALRRHREFQRASDLLRGLLAYVLCAPSFRQLGGWAVLIGLTNISHVAWRGHLRKARAWLLWLLCELLAATAAPADSQSPSMPRILLIDATRLKQPGGSGDDWRVHLGYDLLGARLVDVRVADRHTAEAFELFVLGPGDIVIADRGYSRCRQLAYALRQGAHVVVRLEVQKVPLLDEQGQQLDVVAWLRESQDGTQSRAVAFDSGGQRFRGRLIACALPAAAAERARDKARKKASKQQRQLKEQTLLLAGWLLVFCSLPAASWSDSQVLALYRARWQIELLIKRMKSVLKLAQLRGKTALTNEATILALLVCWALQQQEAQQGRDPSGSPCLNLAGHSSPRASSRAQGANGEQLAADRAVCANATDGSAGVLDACTLAGLSAPPPPLCVRESTPTAAAGKYHSPSIEDSVGWGCSRFVSCLLLFKCLS